MMAAILLGLPTALKVLGVLVALIIGVMCFAVSVAALEEDRPATAAVLTLVWVAIAVVLLAWMIGYHKIDKDKPKPTPEAIAP